MDSLVVFLVEQGYADNYKSAEKILECISDEFYEHLVESTNDASAEVARLTRRANDLMRAGKMSEYTKLLAQIAAAKKASQEANKNNTPDPRKTADPKTSWISGNRQKSDVRDPRTGPTQQQRSLARSARRISGVGSLDYYSPKTGQVYRGASNLDVDGSEGIQIRSDKTRKDNASGGNNPRRINSREL